MKKYVISYFLVIIISNAGVSQESTLKIEPYIFENSKGEQIDAELGNFKVPENRSSPEGKQLTLKFVRFKSTSPNPGSPIIYLAGGPGGSGINTARGPRFDLFMRMREIGDVIAFDQRGTGMSDGLPDYPGYYLVDLSKPMTPENASEAIASEVIKMEDFYQELGHDLSAYNTNESADDINDLRKVLGEDKVSLWGISYGTHLALTTLKRHEQHINRCILAGVEGYDHTVKLPSDQQDLLERIDSLLKIRPETQEIYPDFLGDLENLLSKVGRAPVTINVRNPLNHEEVLMVLGKFDLQILFSWSLGAPENFKDLPLLVKKMLKGDFSGITEYAIYTRAGQFNGMSTAMDIASGISDERLERITTESRQTLLGDAINFPYLIEYNALKHFDLGAEFRTPFESEVPVMCISGTLDGRTSVRNAKITLKSLANGHHLIIDGAGHSDPLFLSSPKITEYMIDFMKGEDIGNPRISLPLMEFDLPAN
ncbi:alpha/beta hydrolase [Portibacter marinus]|uniref:alpha/beta hydrolase n=1 Tax=Portibacter marinus TaxID=2898660 RepID=UPI001F3467C0|nr:alpha/beta hydrolase [Portibacter marinus]